MPNNFTPLTHEELRELWELYACHTEFISSVRARKLILSAVWWEAMENRRAWQSANPQYRKQDQLLWNNADWFLAKLAEIGIELEEVKDG